MPLQDYVLNNFYAVVGRYIAIKDNTNGNVFTSTAKTDLNGSFTITPTPPGNNDYTMYMGPVDGSLPGGNPPGTGWTSTGDIHYTIPGSVVSGAVTIRVSHTFSIPGALAVASGATNFIPGFFVPVPAGQTVTLRAVRAVIRAGTSATIQITRNGTQVGSNVTVTTTAATTTFSQAISDQDLLAVVVSAVSGSPDGLSASFEFDYPNL